MTTGLSASIAVAIGTFDLELDIEVDDGEVVALLGPNGSGKTTALRAIAGLQPIDRGRVTVGGVTLDDPGAGVFVPPESRPVGVVFQDYLLFPRLSVVENVAFGLRARGIAKADARARAKALLDRLDLAGRADARPATLSGGQQQRVALARALATEPRLLLLDEPLAALDAGARLHVRAELRRNLASFEGARLLVTHDPVDAVVLADRLVVLEGGRATQAGTVAEVTRRPASRYVADLVGINLLHGTAAGERTVRLDSGFDLVVADPLPSPSVALAIRPQAVALHAVEPEGSPRNSWPATVADVEDGRDRARVQLTGPVALVAEVTPAAVAELALRPGVAVWASVKAVDLVAYER